MKRREFISLLGGAATVWPLAARTQQQTMPVIGFLSSLRPNDRSLVVTAFHRGLLHAGYFGGGNIAIEYRWAAGRFDKRGHWPNVRSCGDRIRQNRRE